MSYVWEDWFSLSSSFSCPSFSKIDGFFGNITGKLRRDQVKSLQHIDRNTLNNKAHNHR